jgi:hypothetical protein
MTDDGLVRAFEDGSLPAEAFHREQHVRVAWTMLKADPSVRAFERYVTGIRRFATRQGVPHKYHETITWAYLLLVRERLARGGGDGEWDEFRDANADLLAKGGLRRWYREETLASELARRVFVFPDR